MFAQVARAADVLDREWVFSTEGDPLGWRAENALASGVGGGALWSESGASPAYFVNEGPLDLAARRDHYVEIRLRLRPASSPSARFAGAYAGIYFTTDTSPAFDETKKATFRAYGTGTWKTYNVWVGSSAAWQGTIKRLRVDPSPLTNLHIEIQSIRILQDRTGPEFDLKNHWTYTDNDSISYNTPSLVLMNAFDRVSEISKVEFYRRPAGAGDGAWVLSGVDESTVGTWQHKYPPLPNGSYDLGVKAYDKVPVSNGWDYPQAVVHNLTINTALTPRIDVDAAAPAEPFDRMIAGNNEIWYKWSDSYDPVANSLNPNLEALLADCGITVIRYPGGCHSDTFYWKKSIGPVASRPSQYGNPCAPVPVNRGPAKFGLDEFCRWCKARGIEPMFTTRFRWPTAGGAPGQDGRQPYLEALNDAVDLVEYCNAPSDGSNWNGGTDWAAVRAANGHPEPYHLKYIEIGNEPFKPDPWGSPSLVGLDGPGEYALAFLSYYDAIKATDSSVIVTPSSYLDFHGDYRGSLVNNWPYQVLSTTGPFIEQTQFHKYFPYSPTQPDIVRLYNETMACAKEFEDAFGAFRIIQKLTAPDRQDLIKVQLNEWDINYYWTNNPTFGWINADQIRTWKAALGTADSLRIFLLNRDLLSVACHWLIQDDGWGLVQHDNVTPNPVWFIFSAFHQHFGTKLIPSKFTGAPTLDWDGYQGGTPALFNIPKLTGMASLSDDNGAAYLWVINKDRDNAITSDVNIAGFLQAAGQRLLAETWEMNSDDVDDYTTKRNVYRNITTALYDPSFSYTFPAHSLTCFKFTPAAPDGSAAPGIELSPPSRASTHIQDVTFTVSYSGAYEATLSAADITLETTGTAIATVEVSGSGPTSRTVSLRGISGDGTLRISIAPGTAHDGFGNYAAGAGPCDPVAVVENPGASVIVGLPSLAATRTGPVTYSARFDGAASATLSAAHVTLNKTGTADGSVTVAGTGTRARIITINGTTGDGTLSISIAAGAARDSAGAPSAAVGPSVEFAVDNTAPAVASIEGPTSPITGVGPVSYTVTFTEPVEGFDSEDDIEVSPSGTAQVGSVGIGVDNTGPSAGPYTVTLASISGDGEVSIAVKAGACVDRVGLPNAGAAGASFIVDNTVVSSVGAAKQLEDGAPVALDSKVVSAVFSGHIYIQEPDRSCGVKVITADARAVGDLVSVTGWLDASGDEVAIAAGLVALAGDTRSVSPVALTGRLVGGTAFGLQNGVEGGVGLNNTGLLVRTWGRVDQIGPGYLYVDDLSGVRDGTATGTEPNAGVRVLCDPSGFAPGEYLLVTGISSCFPDTAGKLQRCILARSPADIERDASRPLSLERISDVRPLAAGTLVSLPAKVVSAVFGGFFYIEEPDRSSGIRVVSDASVREADLARVVGEVAGINGELQIIASSVLSEPGSQPVAPLAMSNRALASGGETPGSTGLLVRSWGVVTSAGAGGLYIDDGSAVSDGTLTDGEANVGVRVTCDSSGFSEGDYLVVTGVSSCFVTPSGRVVTTLLPRVGDGIVVQQKAGGFASIALLKHALPGSEVVLDSGVVTATAVQMGGFMYLEDASRSAGIRVGSTQPSQPGDVVRAAGTLRVLESGELELSGAVVEVVSSAMPLPPLALRLCALGGGAQGFQPMVGSGLGPNNVGLLVRVWGRIGFIDPGGQFFNISDGSAVTDADGREGVRVWAPGMIPQHVSAGQFVLVTGISSCDRAGDVLLPLVRARAPADIVTP